MTANISFLLLSVSNRNKNKENKIKEKKYISIRSSDRISYQRKLEMLINIVIT